MHVLVATGRNRADRLCAPLEAAGVSVQPVYPPDSERKAGWLREISHAACDGADAFISHEGGVIGLWTALEARRHGVPSVMRWRGDFWQEHEDLRRQGQISALRIAAGALLLRELAAISDLILPVSNSLGRSVIEHTGCHPGKVSAIPIPVDLSRFSPEGERARREETPGGEREHVIGLAVIFRYVQKVDGLERFLPVLRALVEAREDTAVAVAGDGPLRENFVRRNAQLLDHPGIRLVGHVSDMPAFYRGIDALCHFSFFDACPNVLFEAWGSGLPVVVNAYAPLLEHVVNGVNGYVLPEAVPEDCLPVFERLLDDPRHRRRLGRAGREMVQEKLSLESIGGRLVEALRTVADR
jgi:glycosyltransferase involved in cell wall biosynthesis